MDPITNIETEIKEVLLKIDGFITPEGYKYNNTVTVVNIDDEALAEDYGDFPTISVYLIPDEKILTGTTKLYSNELEFEMVCAVALETDDIVPRFAVNEEMNKMIADLKKVFTDYNTINCSCTYSQLTRSRRVYNQNGDAFRVGDVVMTMKVSYMQSRLNPNTVKK